MTRIRIQKMRKSRKRSSSQPPLEALGVATGGSSRLLERLEDLLEEIDRTLLDAGQS